ncbi:MAG: hypothetical protein GY796_33690, partial [Chloroflexi bacterium]|nr:hypothetical protein [Chloroflexota bacterium]
DFNDYVDSEPLGALAGAGLYNLMARVGPSTRYTFIYQGVSQTLDHVLVSPALAANSAENLFTHPIHLNADYPASYEGDDSTARRSSDHEPIVVKLVVFEAFIYLPLIQR